jgi:hypothetical protein
MSNVSLLLSYKLKSFFAPSYRGKFGPLPLIGLSLVFLPSGISVGYYMGEAMMGSDPEFAVNLLGTALSGMMVFGFIFALGVGITAQPSELDFLMTTPVRPREYLVADLLFQFGSLMIAGGMAILFSVFGLLWGMGVSMLLAVPVLLLLGLYGMMVFFIIQSLTVLRIRHPQSMIRAVVLVLLFLSAVPMLSLASSDFPVRFGDLPIPQSAVGAMAFDVLNGSGVEIRDAMIVAAYLAVVIALWARVSGMYYFHGVKPTLSAGFGQVDMSSKMAQQKRMITGFGRFTTKIGLRTDSGGELSLMTRLSLIRFWRDGSFVFVALLLAIFLGTGVMQSSSDKSSPITLNLFQAGAWPIAILALNWCYYERENLWIPVVGGRPLVSYFRGLMMALVVVGVAIAAVILGILFLAGVVLDAANIALVISTPIADAAIATILLTRIRVKPGAFSPGLLAVLFGTILLGAGISGAIWMLVGAIGDSTSLLVAAQFVVMAGLVVCLCAAGLAAVTRLARGFRFA